MFPELGTVSGLLHCVQSPRLLFSPTSLHPTCPKGTPITLNLGQKAEAGSSREGNIPAKARDSLTQCPGPQSLQAELHSSSLQCTAHLPVC